MSATLKYIKQAFPEFVEPKLQTALVENLTFMSCPAGTILVEVGAFPKVLPLVVSGRFKVIREDDTGKEIFLYHLREGETCAMSINCCRANKPSEIKAVAEDDSELLALPIQFIEAWRTEFKSWNNFIIKTYNQRFDELLETIDNIAFLKMDERLLRYLHEMSKDKNGVGVINTTHQQIAIELNSSREVISRLLKQLETKGIIKLGRNYIELLTTV